MPAKKTLRELALSGTLRNNPGRYASRARTSDLIVGPLGQPPRHLSAQAKKVWREIVKDAPEGLLTSADRMLLEIACFLTLKMRSGMVKNSELGLLSSVLAKLGLTPVDRNKVEAPQQPEPEKDPNAPPDPWDQFVS